MILDTTSKVLEIILGGAITTSNGEFTADYVDTANGTTFAPGGAVGVSNGATLVVAVPAPAVNIQRSVRAFTFYNADTVNTTVTVRIFDGVNRRRIVTVTLGVGQSLVFTPESGWSVLPAAAGQIPGTTTNDNAAAGCVGEYFESVVLFSAPLAVVTATDFNLASLTLSAGDWQVAGSIVSVPAGATITSLIQGGLNTVSATRPNAELRSFDEGGQGSTAGFNVSISLTPRRFSFSVPTTVYAVGQLTFTISTMSACGFIAARRAR